MPVLELTSTRFGDRRDKSRTEWARDFPYSCPDTIPGQPHLTPRNPTRRKYDADEGKEHAGGWFRHVDRGGDDTIAEATRLSTEDRSVTAQQHLAAGKSAVHEEVGLEGFESEQLVRFQNEE